LADFDFGDIFTIVTDVNRLNAAQAGEGRTAIDYVRVPNMASFETVQLASTVMRSLTRKGNSFNEHMLNKNAASEIFARLTVFGRYGAVAWATRHAGMRFLSRRPDRNLIGKRKAPNHARHFHPHRKSAPHSRDRQALR
jgi:hypothetical protein